MATGGTGLIIRWRLEIMRFTHHIAASIKFRVAWDSRLTGLYYMFHMLRDQDPISILKTTCEVAILPLFPSLIFLIIST